MVQSRFSQSQLPTNVCYLAVDYPQHTQCSVFTPKHFNDPHVLLEAYRQRAKRYYYYLLHGFACHWSCMSTFICIYRLVSIAMKRYSTSGNNDPITAWNNSSVDWMNAAKVMMNDCGHCSMMIYRHTVIT